MVRGGAQRICNPTGKEWRWGMGDGDVKTGTSLEFTGGTSSPVKSDELLQVQ